ncbi:MAG: hypothetical protein ABMA25_06590, partial [Ilumatobacteraceae bacterium]
QALVFPGAIVQLRSIIELAIDVATALVSVIIAGAVWSAWRVWRGRTPSLGTARTVAVPGRLVAGNLLIAAGTLVLSASGTIAGRLGKDRAFAITLLVGITILFAGFLVASATPRRTALAAVRRSAA